MIRRKVRGGSGRRPRARRALRPPLGVPFSLLLVAIAVHPLWLPVLGRFLVVNAEPRPAEAVAPLVGEPQRADYAAQLVRDGYARVFVVTPIPTAEERAAYRRQVLALARLRGVPDGSILHVPSSAPSTYEEARTLRRFAETQGLESLLVVTSPWHTRRSNLAVAAAFRGSDVAVQVVPLPNAIYDLAGRAYRPERWWKHAHSRRATLSEYLKLAAFALGVR